MGSGPRSRGGLAVALALCAVTLAILGVTPIASSQPHAVTGSLAGQLLVATPEMPDPRFARTVIYMARHDRSGAQGFVLNRPLGEIPLAELLQQMRMPSEGVQGTVRLHSGGPVEGLRMFVLHTADYTGEGTQLVKDGIALTDEPAILRAIAQGKGPRRVLFALGYAGWAPGQLEAEVKAGGWVRATATEALVFDTDADGVWDRAMARRKIDL